jgi:hypothetical protein
MKRIETVMKKVEICMSSMLMVGLLSSPVWAAPTALNDADMDGVYAQGITIENKFQDNDTLNSTNTQTSSNTLSGSQTNTPDNDANAIALAGGGDATGSASGTNNDPSADGGDGIGLGFGLGGDGGAGGADAGAGGAGGLGAGLGAGAGGNGGLAGGNIVPGGNALGGPALAGAAAGVLNPNLNIDPDLQVSANVALNQLKSVNFVYQVIKDVNVADNGSVAIDDIYDSAVANLDSIAVRYIKEGNFQGAVNGDNTFNNLQNQLSINDSPQLFSLDVPTISTDIKNVAAPTAVALGVAKSGPAVGFASNKSDQTNIPVAVSAATNFGQAKADADAVAKGYGGDAIQIPIADSDNKGVAYAGGNDGGTSVAADLALGLAAAGSAAINPAGNGALAAAEGGDTAGNDANALGLAFGAGGDDNDALSAALAASLIGQQATAGDANGGKSDADVDQLSLAGAKADADTSGTALAGAGAKAYNDQYAEADDAKAEGKNYLKQDNDVKAASTATNVSAADASGTKASVYVKQNNLVKSLQVGGANDNKGNIFFSIQSTALQQVNNVSSPGSSPVVQGNAVAVNTLFN